MRFAHAEQLAQIVLNVVNTMSIKSALFLMMAALSIAACTTEAEVEIDHADDQLGDQLDESQPLDEQLSTPAGWPSLKCAKAYAYMVAACKADGNGVIDHNDCSQAYSTYVCACFSRC